MNDILDKEAPISYERLFKKTLRGFEIGRASAQTIEATDKVIKKMSLKANRQNGMKFYWKAVSYTHLDVYKRQDM